MKKFGKVTKWWLLIVVIVSCVTTEAKKEGGFMDGVLKYKTNKKLIRAAVPVAALLSGIGLHAHYQHHPPPVPLPPPSPSKTVIIHVPKPVAVPVPVPVYHYNIEKHHHHKPKQPKVVYLSKKKKYRRKKGFENAILPLESDSTLLFDGAPPSHNQFLTPENEHHPPAAFNVANHQSHDFHPAPPAKESFIRASRRQSSDSWRSGRMLLPNLNY